MTEVTPLTEDQLDYLSEQTDRAARHAVRRFALKAAIAYLVVLGGVFVALQAQSQTLEDASMGSCHRVNVLRAQSNASDLVSFNILSLSGQREKMLAEQAGAGERQTHLASADALFEQAKKLTVTELTDCAQAVAHPTEYVNPIAGPIGDPSTGELSPDVEKIANASEAFLNLNG